MTLQQLRYAVTIADMKSMNKAASELFVSQPALSNTIHDLEEELQIEIFLRTNRGIVVTTEGEEFLSYARQMVELQQCPEHLEDCGWRLHDFIVLQPFGEQVDQ